MSQYDIAIIGGGLVGATFARAIAKFGLNTILIDRAPAQDLYKHNLDNRGLALAYSTKQILTALGVWGVLAEQAFPITTIHVSEQHSFGFTKLQAAHYNLPALGYVISASQLGLAIIHGLESLPGLTVLRPATVSAVEYDNVTATWKLSVAQQTVQAKLLIAADGSNSVVRQLQGITCNFKHFNQTAIVTNIGCKLKNLSTAYERFTTTGVLALLPFGVQQLKCIYTLDNAHVDQLLNLPPAQFLAKVQQAIGFRAGNLLSVDERNAFPISYTYVDKVTSAGLVLLGNAANTLHPVAAQGFNLGVRDVVCLARVLQQALVSGAAINSDLVLQKYAALRAADHLNTRNFSNNLVEIFAHDLPWLKFSRRFGLVATQFIPGLQRRIVTQGIGTWM